MTEVTMTGNANDAEPLLTPAEVAARFRVDPKTVTRWAKAGKLTSNRTLVGHRRYHSAEVQALLESQIPTQRAGEEASGGSASRPAGLHAPRLRRCSVAAWRHPHMAPLDAHARGCRGVSPASAWSMGVTGRAGGLARSLSSANDWAGSPHSPRWPVRRCCRTSSPIGHIRTELVDVVLVGDGPAWSAHERHEKVGA